MTKKSTKKIEEEAVAEIMKAKEEKDIEAPLEIDVKKSQEVAAKSVDLEDEDNKRLGYFNPQGKFAVLELSGGRYRVVNKAKQFVSSFLTLSEATILANKFNLKDPEQKISNIKRKQGLWGEEETKRLTG